MLHHLKQDHYDKCSFKLLSTDRKVLTIQCPKCGRDNPSQAKFCFNCGDNLEQSKDFITFSPTLSKHCQQCGEDNPENALFCYSCGIELKKQIKTSPKSKICPTCGITVNYSTSFCPNCNQLLGEETVVSEPKISSIQQKAGEIRECPACGLEVKGDYCHNCGYHLLETQKRSSHNWWYCQRDSAIMAEVDQNQQIPVSRESVDESLAKAIDSRILQPHDREKAKILALQILDEGIVNNFTVITKVKCPVCGSDSYAPVTKRPRKVSGYGTYKQLTLNAGNILRNGIFFLRNYPVLLVIALGAIIIDIITYMSGLGAYSLINTDALVSGSIPTTEESFSGFSIFPSDPTNALLLFGIGMIISILITAFSQCWYLTSLQGIRRNSNNTLNLIGSLTSCFKYLPRSIIAQFIITSFATGTSLLLLIATDIILTSDIYEHEMGSVLFWMLFLLVLSMILLALSFLLSIFFAYVFGSIVFSEAGIVKSFKDSYKFARKYLGTTFGVIIVFNFAVTLIAIPVGMLAGSASLISGIGPSTYVLMTALSGALVNRSVEAYKTVSLGWAYDEFKTVIEDN